MKYKYVYTIGCFDQFHKGHNILLNKMKKEGEILIVGVHDDASIEKLKNLTPEVHNSIVNRMNNVKKIADIVYVISDTDPTDYIINIIFKDSNKDNSCYIRGDDMIDFPAKELVSKVMNIKYYPYTQGISATMLRKQKNK